MDEYAKGNRGTTVPLQEIMSGLNQVSMHGDSAFQVMTQLQCSALDLTGTLQLIAHAIGMTLLADVVRTSIMFHARLRSADCVHILNFKLGVKVTHVLEACYMGVIQPSCEGHPWSGLIYAVQRRAISCLHMHAETERNLHCVVGPVAGACTASITLVKVQRCKKPS